MADSEYLKGILALTRGSMVQCHSIILFDLSLSKMTIILKIYCFLLFFMLETFVNVVVIALIFPPIALISCVCDSATAWTSSILLL